MTIIAKEWNKERQLEQIGVSYETGNLVIQNGVVVPETKINKPNTDYIVYEIENCDRMRHTSIAELTRSNANIEQQKERYLDNPEKIAELQGYIEENNHIISLIRELE